MTSDVNKIHSDMLENISNDYQKTQGFPTYDLTRAFAITCLALYVKAQDIENKLDVNNLSGNDLTRFIEQRRNLLIQVIYLNQTAGYNLNLLKVKQSTAAIQ